MKTSHIFLSILLLSSSAFASNQSYSELSDEMDGAKASTPLVWIGVNTAPIGVGAAAGAPIIPISAGIRIAGGLSIGPMLTFSGKYKYQDTDLSLSGFGAQAIYNFGQSAIADGFFITGFYQHYSLNGTKMAAIAELGGMTIPLEGSLPINSMGGGIGYQWVMKSGFRISAGIQVAYLKTNADGLELMGMSGTDLAMMGGGGGTEVSQNVNVPLIENRSVMIPMPELSIGWSF